MSRTSRFVLVGLIVPLAITGLVCWLTPWLALPEAFLYDRFLQARPLQPPSDKVVVVLWNDTAPPQAEEAKGEKGDADPVEILHAGLRKMADGQPGLVAVSGELVEVLPQVFHNKPSLSTDNKSVAVVSLAEDPARLRTPVSDKYADALLLWWNNPEGWGDAVYLRRLLTAEKAEGSEQDESREKARLARVEPRRLPSPAASDGRHVLIAALRPLPSLPLWSGEHLRATNWYGPRGTFRTVTMKQVADGSLSADQLAGAVVVLGRRQDLRVTPMGPMSCAEAHANLLLTALQRRWIVPLPPWWHWLILFVAASLAGTVVASTSGFLALVIILLEVASVGMIARGALQTDQWFCCTPALAAIALSALSALVLSLGFVRLD
ncbi:MAG: CHASE2 domain-containing protein, partial [Armatimonadetes bacterium]|nr:CHASE2 domain-containing protein [Armatimonadota bacterium]